MPELSPPIILCFGVADATGATGIGADVVVGAAMGCHVAAVTTVITVQDSRQVDDVHVIDDDLIDSQARSVLQDMPVAVFKVGAVGSSANAQVIAEILSDYDSLPMVLDPRLDLAAADGSQAELAVATRELLMPMASVVMLNLGQAQTLIALNADDAGAEDGAGLPPDASQCARRLLDWGAKRVFLTAAQVQPGRIVNRLYGAGGEVQSESIDVVDVTVRGAGDTLSAGVAALLAQGLEIGDAIREASEFLAGSLESAYRIGMGDAVPDRMFWAGNDDDDDADDEDPDDDGGGPDPTRRSPQ